LGTQIDRWIALVDPFKLKAAAVLIALTFFLLGMAILFMGGAWEPSGKHALHFWHPSVDMQASRQMGEQAVTVLQNVTAGAP